MRNYFLAIGVMSGTSADGIDISLIRTDGKDYFKPLSSLSISYSDDLRKKIINFSKSFWDKRSHFNIILLEELITKKYIEGIKKLLVKLDKDKLTETNKEAINFNFLGKDITSKIPDGSSFEIIKDLDLICEKLSSFFNYCVMITIDYGFNNYNKLFFKNPNGLVRCYSKHSMDKNILEGIGEKDITCDVNFNYLNESLNKFGFHKIGNTSQEKFLIKNGFRKYFDASDSEKEKKSLISLVNPDGMGGFHVYFHEKPKINFLPSCLND